MPTKKQKLNFTTNISINSGQNWPRIISNGLGELQFQMTIEFSEIVKEIWIHKIAPWWKIPETRFLGFRFHSPIFQILSYSHSFGNSPYQSVPDDGRKRLVRILRTLDFRILIRIRIISILNALTKRFRPFLFCIFFVPDKTRVLIRHKLNMVNSKNKRGQKCPICITLLSSIWTHFTKMD